MQTESNCDGFAGKATGRVTLENSTALRSGVFLTTGRMRRNFEPVYGQSIAEIDEQNSRPENRQQASDQLAVNSPIELHHQKSSRKNQTIPGPPVGTGLEEIKGIPPVISCA